MLDGTGSSTPHPISASALDCKETSRLPTQYSTGQNEALSQWQATLFALQALLLSADLAPYSTNLIFSVASATQSQCSTVGAHILLQRGHIQPARNVGFFSKVHLSL
jgi:hypothetical protein